jgi:hypothetical protein
MNLDLTDDETAALLREIDGLIDGDRYFMSRRVQSLKAIRANIRSEPVREPLNRTAGNARNKFATDSSLEGDGFEPSVPGDSDDGFRSNSPA